MASSLPPSSYRAYSLISPSLKSSFYPPRVVIRAQKFRDDEGRRPSSDVVEANLGVLRRRIEEAKANERLDQCCRCEIGWDYTNYNTSNTTSVTGRGRRPPNACMSESLELACLIFGNIGITFVGGTLFLCLTSLLINLCSLTG